MRRDFFYLILLLLGGIIACCDMAFVIYIGVIISSVLGGISFLPAIFSTLCIALAVINGVGIAYALLYIFVLRK